MRGQLLQSSLSGNNFPPITLSARLKYTAPSAEQTFTVSARTNGPESGSINPLQAGLLSLKS